MIHSPLNRSFICYSIFIRFSPTFRFNVRVRPNSKRTVPKPFSKDNEKPSCDSSNYRPIFLHNTLINICERYLQQNCKFYSREYNTPFQSAYQEGRSTSVNIPVLHELVLDHGFKKSCPRGGNNIKKVLYLSFLESRKAFDTVTCDLWHTLHKIYREGIRGKMLRVMRDLFSSNSANILIENLLEREIIINLGVYKAAK